MDLSGCRTLIVGLGRTGVATARFCAGKGATVAVADEKEAFELEDGIAAIGDVSVELKLGGPGNEVLSAVDLVIPSPGVPPVHHLLRAARERGIPVMSEIELAYRYVKTPIIAVTGTNGKTTTTELIGEFFTSWGKKVFVGGNIGNPLIGIAGNDDECEYLVVEVSSFQLMWIDRFRPFISLLLNVTPDHIDYHGSFGEYRRAKERIFENQTGGDLAILNGDDPEIASLGGMMTADVAWFSSSLVVERGMFRKGNFLCCSMREGTEESYPIDAIRLRGNHNYENIMAAILAARRCGCPPQAVRRTLETFSGLPHRIEFVEEAKGVEFYNDSKGTNVDAVIRALEAFSKPVVLLLGGRNKGGDFARLAGSLKEKARMTVLFGEARHDIRTMLGDAVKTVVVETLKEAIDTAWSSSRPGDAVLLSPGCASFDEFHNYQERGDLFKQTVRRLVEGR